MKKISLIFLLVVLSAAMVFAGGKKEESTEEWPTKEITFVYHSKAGSGGDIMCRNIGKAIKKTLGQPIVVENRLGAPGYTVWNYTKKAAPDGYTFNGISSTFITSQLINEMDIHPTDYEPVAVMFVDPMIIYCRPESWKDFKDFESDVRANPGKYKIAGGTPGALDFMVFKQFKEKTGLKITEVPFEGGGEATIAVAGKHLDLGIGEYVDVMPMVEAGKLKVLVAFNKMEGLDIPTLEDYGYDVSVKKLRGVIAPKGTPKEILNKLYDAIKIAYDDPEFKNYYESNQLVPYLKGPDEAMDVLMEQYNKIKSDLSK